MTLTTPSSGGEALTDGRTGYDLGTGAMSVEKTPTADAEIRSDNNTAFNTTGTVQVVTSEAETRPVVQVTNTYAGGDKDGDGAPNAADDSRISLSGVNAGSDNITQVVLSYTDANGELYYDGTPLSVLAGQPGSGVVITGSGSDKVVTITDPGIINSMASGSGSTKLTYKQTTYNDKDVAIDSSVTVQDKFSSDTNNVTSDATIIVDAVARNAQTVDAVIAGYTGAAQAGGTVEF